MCIRDRKGENATKEGGSASEAHQIVKSCCYISAVFYEL